MKRKDYLIIFMIALLIRGGVGLLQKSPGFMDAEYYFIGGKSLAQGEGFVEYVLWNYLDDPSGIPHPSHTYWMPMPSIIAAFGMVVTQNQGFAVAQLIFILVGSLFPPLTTNLCYAISRNRASALVAGGIAVFSGFYLPFMTTSDTFGIYAVLGAIYFILLSEPLASKRTLTPTLLGTVAGLMHLSRADGILWLGFAGFGSIYLTKQIFQERVKLTRYFLSFLFVLGGYLVIMGPWFIRNLTIFGSLLTPGGSRSLWITTYNELFIYPASQLTMERWLATGLESILQARTWALKINLQRNIAELGMIFLTPLIILGLWQYRKDFRVKMGMFIWLSTFLVMTLIFPFQGARGGLFHSNAALLPLFWAVAPMGLDAILEWAHRVRNWNVQEARIVFSGAILIFALLLTAFTTGMKLLPLEQDQPSWEENRTTYQQLEENIIALGAHPEDIVLTINPPGYFAHTHRPALAIPDGDLQTVVEVANRYGGKYLLLEPSHTDGLQELFANPETPHPGLRYLAKVDNNHIYIFE
jgi:hypothetical protein